VELHNKTKIITLNVQFIFSKSLIPGYSLVLIIIWFSDEEFLSIAIDAGGVATGPMANTFLLSLALGVSSSLGGQDLIVHGLGLVALIALAPIISVMVLGFILAIKKRRIAK